MMSGALMKACRVAGANHLHTPVVQVVQLLAHTNGSSFRTLSSQASLETWFGSPHHTRT